MNINIKIRNKRCSGNRRNILFTLFDKIKSEYSVVDVGCGSLAKEFSKDFSLYKGIDIPDSYNSKFFSEQEIIFYDFTTGNLPTLTGADLLLCLDVIEHVEEPKKLLQSILQTGIKQIIISLPNNWLGMSLMYKVGKAKYTGYGFPFDGFKPGKRHYFFFNTQEAILFMVQGSSKLNFNIIDIAIDYRKGADGPIFWIPYIGGLLRFMITASKESYIKRIGNIFGNIFFYISRVIDLICLILNDSYCFFTCQPRGSMKHANKFSSGVYFNIQPYHKN
jgi:2-polyprenyl-3-methyl-5-hydroxy-6-metoxy-1,4-benzoquinol methylase